MNKFFSFKRFLTILSILLAASSQILVAQAQKLPTNKTGRDFAVNDEIKQESQNSFAFDGTVNRAPGNPTCKDLSSIYQEFKVDPPKSGNYSFAGNQSVITNIFGGESGLTYADYQSTISFVAVIVKGGNQGANVYSFNSPQTALAGLTTPNLQDISHISFCYVPGYTTTSAPVSVSGTVTGENGRGIGRTTVTIQNLNTEETRTVTTNWMGHYRFEYLPVGHLYVITINNKKAGLSRQTRLFVLNADLENLNFTPTDF